MKNGDEPPSALPPGHGVTLKSVQPDIGLPLKGRQEGEDEKAWHYELKDPFAAFVRGLEARNVLTEAEAKQVLQAGAECTEGCVAFPGLEENRMRDALAGIQSPNRRRIDAELAAYDKRQGMDLMDWF